MKNDYVDDVLLAHNATVSSSMSMLGGTIYHIPQDCDLNHHSRTAEDPVCMCVIQHATPEDTLHSLFCVSYLLIFISIYSLIRTHIKPI
jgi:hypothetical protein